MKARQLVIDGQVLKVCRLCYRSRAELWAAYPSLKAIYEHDVSHGICDEHRDQLLINALESSGWAKYDFTPEKQQQKDSQL